MNSCSWDGEWYISYFDHEGKPIGSKVNSSGQIYANAQSWAVISSFAGEDRALKSLDSVRSILNTRNGIKLSYPGYKGYDPKKGGIPHIRRDKENGEYSSTAIPG